MNTRQRQSVLEGKLTLQNTINSVESNLLVETNSTFLDRYDENISRVGNIIRYQIVSSPESPNIRLIQDGEEVSTISLNTSSTVSTNIEIISPHPITIFRGISVINTTRILRSFATTQSTTLRTRSFSLDDDSDAVNNFLVSRDYPIFSNDGNYHYFLTITPTEDNNTTETEAEPLKLGDLSIVSRIYDASTRPNEWVIVNDGSNSLSLLKILLRTDNPRIIDLSTTSLPSIKNSIPGTAYILNPDSNYYYVSPDYGLVREVQDQSLFDYISNPYKYYYQQSEIDDLFGVAEKKVSVIQNGSYYYKLVRLGNTNGVLNFLGETREFRLYKIDTGTGDQTPVSNAEYSIIDVVNCIVTVGNNDGSFSLTAPNRILNYSPYNLSGNSLYTSFVYTLPVSSCVRINSLGAGDMKTVGNYLQLRGGSSVEKSIIKLDREPISGTSGQDFEFNKIYYKDRITGLYKFIPTIETYKKTIYLDSSGLIEFRSEEGYTTYICKSSDWSVYSINTGLNPDPDAVINNLLNEKKAKYGSDAFLTGYLNTSNLPINTDDSLLEAEEWSNPGTPNLTIQVDNIPNIVMLSTSNYKIGYSLRAGGGQSSVVKVYKAKITNYRIKCLRSNPSWQNFIGIEKLYHSMGIASKNNGYYWSNKLMTLLGSENNNTPMSNPDDWTTPTGPAISASYDSFGESYYLWSRKSTTEEGDVVVEVDSLPNTKGETNSNVWYHYGSNYYKATDNLYTCKLNPQYSIVALNKSPERYNTQTIYMKGDIVQFFDNGVNYTYKSKIDNNEGRSIPETGTSNSYWEYVGDIKEYSESNVKYKYYEIDVASLENTSIGTGTSLPGLVTSSSPTYFGLKYDSNPRVQKYYRKGFDFEINDGSSDHGTWRDAGDNVTVPYNNRIFHVTEGGSNYYYQLKKFAVDVVIPDNYSTIQDSSLKNSNTPGNIVLKGDSYGCGFGKDKSNSLAQCFYGSILYDFNQYKIRHQIFDENINYTQRSISSGLVSNFSGSYKLYLSNDPQNTIEVHVGPEETEVSGFIGVYNLNSQITPSSSGTGIKPNFLVIQGDSTTTLDTPILDGNDTPNFKASFPENTGDQDIVREYKFSTSDGIFSSSVNLRVIQGTNPGEVRPTKRTLYFLSNGVPFDTSFVFSSNIQNLNLQNIQVINDYGEDILDRSEDGAYVQEINNSTTYSTYSAFLKLKPNTRNEVFSNFRIKIGRVSGNTITDRTLDESTAKFYRLLDDEWVLLDSTYQPTYKEPYFIELPDIDQFNYGDVICVCSSLRGYQGYYTTFLYSPSTNSQHDLMWREKTNLDDVINDLVTITGTATIDRNTVRVITNEIVLPDIKTMKEVGIIYKIEDTYYYTFASRITSDYTYGNLNLPNYISNSRIDTQKYHLEILQREYDSAGNLTNEISINELLSNGENYNISDTKWYLYGVNETAELVDISGEDTCSSEIIFSDTSSTSLTPYFRNSYDFRNYTVSGLINIKTNINLKLKYNNVSGISMDEEYRWVNYLFTLYTRWSNS